VPIGLAHGTLAYLVCGDSTTMHPDHRALP